MITEVVITATKSLLAKGFRSQLEKLPPDVQSIASQKYLRWRNDSNSLNFESKFSNIFTIEITRKIHAICQVKEGIVYWLWIGKYDDYSSHLNKIRTALKMSR